MSWPPAAVAQDRDFAWASRFGAERVPDLERRTQGADRIERALVRRESQLGRQFFAERSARGDRASWAFAIRGDASLDEGRDVFLRRTGRFLS